MSGLLDGAGKTRSASQRFAAPPYASPKLPAQIPPAKIAAMTEEERLLLNGRVASAIMIGAHARKEKSRAFAKRTGKKLDAPVLAARHYLGLRSWREAFLSIRAISEFCAAAQQTPIGPMGG